MGNIGKEYNKLINFRYLKIKKYYIYISIEKNYVSRLTDLFKIFNQVNKHQLNQN